MTKTLDEHGRLLKECLKFCTGALNAATETTPGTKVKYAKALNNAKSLIGNIGSEAKAGVPDVIVDTAEADGHSVMGIGNISVEALRILMGK